MKFCRRQVLTGGVAGGMVLAGSLLGARPVAAAQALAGRQVPGIYRLGVGDIEVTAILDGYIDLGIELFPSADAEEVTRLQRANFVPVGPSVRGAVNAFVVNTGEKLVIVDAGARDLMGPTLGQLPANLEAAGIDPEAVDVVALTHMHPDHIGGIVTANGAAVFPNAELVVHTDDWNFWMSPEIMEKANEQGKMFFQAAQAAGTPYAKRLRQIGDDAEVVPGIRSVALPGHTPGHTGYMISSGDQSLLIWADIVNAAILQFPHPDWAIAFDISPEVAIATRRRTFEMAATERLMIAGMHVPFPGIGHVVRDGGFRFVPVSWNYEL
ncbi:MBL fold metallo-hydrolase [Microbaculum marinum]|uniref:MBL fold metallo-hydrolase n=1 Tax=Microbaculum marinum TaxID=1764581 RepID=A0AAW9S1G6_9HYPH